MKRGFGDILTNFFSKIFNNRFTNYLKEHKDGLAIISIIITLISGSISIAVNIMNLTKNAGGTRQVKEIPKEILKHCGDYKKDLDSYITYLIEGSKSGVYCAINETQGNIYVNIPKLKFKYKISENEKNENKDKDIKPDVKLGEEYSEVEFKDIKPIHVALLYGYYDIASYIMFLDKTIVNQRGDSDNMLPIHFAAIGGNLDVVKLLLQHGAKIDDTDGYGYTPLIKAARYGRLSVVKHLVSKGASISKTTNKGFTALIVASYWGYTDVVKYLVEKGVDIDAIDSGGYSSLMNACLLGHTDIVKFLIRKGANYKLKTLDGKTSLMFASISDSIDVVKYLTSLDVDKTVKTKDGKTACDLISSNYSKPQHKDEIVEILGKCK